MTPGYDAVGVIDKLGDGVKGWKVGQRVIRVSSAFGYTEVLLNRANDLVLVPRELESGVAVSLGISGVMAYQLVRRMGRVGRGDTVLIHGAAGGTAHLMVQLCKLAGATVYGTGSTKKQETIESLGAIPIDYQREDVASRIKELTGGEGADIVIDGIGPRPHWEESFKAARMFGRVVLFGMTGGMPGGVPDRDAYRDMLENPITWSAEELESNNVSVSFYSFYSMKVNRLDLFRKDLATMLKLAAQGKITPIIGARLPLAEIRRAHELLDTAAVPGKIILDMRM
jgi:NADPH:quinone reductase-like Zn-dependent oxidoreductase